MKDYKQKYEQAMLRMNKWVEGSEIIDPKEVAEFVFPELKESEDERIRKDIIRVFTGEVGFTTKEEAKKYVTWLEKQGETSIYDVPSRNMILAVWELGNEWKELTNGSISKEYGTQLEYIQKHWNESPYYLRDKQGEQKPADKVEPKFKKE